MNRSVVGSLLLLVALFNNTPIHAVRIQPVFASVEEGGSSEERTKEVYRATAAKQIHQSRNLRPPISLVDIALGSSHQSIRSNMRAQTLLIDPHELLETLRI